ncbi:MAG: NUDIX hydrolase [Pseudomonadota bacterium]
MRLREHDKRAVRTQFGAICWRTQADKVQFLLITSRQRRRWIIPKGWPVNNATPVDAAATEAWEEAGVKGKAAPVCLGIYSYNKYLGKGETLPCVVAVFPIRVKKVTSSYPEADQRTRKWVSRKKAAKLVEEPELAAMFLNFDPRAI